MPNRIVPLPAFSARTGRNAGFPSRQSSHLPPPFVQKIHLRSFGQPEGELMLCFCGEQSERLHLLTR